MMTPCSDSTESLSETPFAPSAYAKGKKKKKKIRGKDTIQE